MNLHAALAFAAAIGVAACTGAWAACVPPAAWVAPGAPAQVLDTQKLLASVAARQVVLLGEAHDDAEHHRWQLQTLAALHALRPSLALAFEAFPRRVQPALERWVAGELSEPAFLQAADWSNVWGIDPQLYLPLFHFARQNRLPMVALNVEKALTREVREKGFDGVDASRREGVTRPAPPPQKYVDFLYPIFAEHERERRAGGEAPGRDSAEFRRFLESQTTWDRAMAQAIAATLATRPAALVAAIAGRHHVAHRHGIAHQLADLGVRDVAVLLPWNGTNCSELVEGLADAVFGLPALPAAPAKKARLGVRVETTKEGVRIAAVEKGSVADAAGLREGDLLVEVAGRPAKRTADVIDAVARQAPGTWLPLRVSRQDGSADLVAKFPPATP